MFCFLGLLRLHLPYTAILFVTRRFYLLLGYYQSQIKKNDF